MAKLDARLSAATSTQLEMLLDRFRLLERRQRQKMDANAVSPHPIVSDGNTERGQAA